MSLTIKTNMPSIRTQSALASSTDKLNQTIERMTTGYRINSAKDDAAGYSIATDMEVKLSSYDVVMDNTMMGSSLLSTATGSMDILTDHLQRIRDLCEQGANGTYSAESRDAMQEEINQRIAEIDRVMASTEYNGIKLLKGTGGTTTGKFITDVDADTPEVYVTSASDLAAVIATHSKIGIGDASTSATDRATILAKLAELVNDGTADCEGKTIILTGDVDLSNYQSGTGWTPIGQDYTHAFRGIFNGNGHTVSNLKIDNPTADNQGLFGFCIDDDSILKNVGIENCNIKGKNGIGGLLGISVTSEMNIINAYVTGNISGNEAVGGLTGEYGGNISSSYSKCNVKGQSYVGGLTGFIIPFNSFCQCSITNSASYASSVIGAYQDSTGSFIGGINKNFTYNSSSIDATITIENGVTTEISGLKKIGGAYTSDIYTDTGNITRMPDDNMTEWNNNIEYISTPAPATSGITLQVGITSDSYSQITVDTSLDLGTLSVDVSTVDNARAGIDTVDAALSKITKKQTTIGAAQNRLDSVAESITTAITNITSSLSTIKDADIAQESSEYVKAQILQQASATLLSTANQAPSIALQLI